MWCEDLNAVDGRAARDLPVPAAGHATVSLAAPRGQRARPRDRCAISSHLRAPAMACGALGQRPWRAISNFGYSLVTAVMTTLQLAG